MKIKLIIVLVIAFILVGCVPENPPLAGDQTQPGLQTSPVPLPTETSTPTPKPTATSIPTPTIPPLTTEIMRNIQIMLPVYQKPVQLTDGNYQVGSGMDFLSVQTADPIVFGDLNGDGVEDAAFVIGENNGGSGTFESLLVFINQNGTPVQAGSTFLGDRVGFSAMTIENQRVVMDEVIHGPSDPLCCPSQPIHAAYRLNKADLLVDSLSSKTPSGQNRAIQITSPEDNAHVRSFITFQGTETISPFENTLAYRIYDQDNQQLAQASFNVEAKELGGPATFNATIDISQITPGQRIWLQVIDTSAADGSTIALDTVELVIDE